MHDFDRLLDSELRRLLDPVVSAPAPVRRIGAGPGRTSKTLRVLELPTAAVPETLVAIPIEVVA
jgi:hypothetical protein